MCDIKQCLLTILYPNTDASIACDEDCYYKGEKTKVCEAQDEEYKEENWLMIDVEKIKRKQ